MARPDRPAPSMSVSERRIHLRRAPSPHPATSTPHHSCLPTPPPHLLEQVVGLHGGALLGVTYRTSHRISPLMATAISTVQSMPLSGFGGSGSSFASDDPFSSREGPRQNLQLYSWETYQPFRYLGDVSIPSATGAVWHRRQLFVATPTTIECVFVDAGVAAVDIETKKRKEEMKARESHGRVVADHGDLALITVEGPQVTTSDKISLTPPMLQI
ncbi:hypothetical protein ZWY2020_003832 [Hordeum vulgare]|nr:hypothetical protein ZWY2020_003832 [Hordeum vulgare]